MVSNPKDIGAPQASLTEPKDEKHRRRFGSATQTMMLIGFMLVSVIASMFYIESKQSELFALRNEAREVRSLRQAMMVADRSVLLALSTAAKDDANLSYSRAVSQIDAANSDLFPSTINRDNKPTPMKAVLASLRGAWDDVVSSLAAGETAMAFDVYRGRQVERDMAAFLAAFADRLDRLETAYAAAEFRIDLTTTLSLAGQILTGLLSLAAIFFSARRGARASKAREEAVEHANATRERVLKLFQMTDMLQSAGDHGDANAVLHSTATQLLPEFSGALYVFNNSRDRLALSTHWGLKAGEEPAESVSLQKCWALKRGKAHINAPGSAGLCCEHHALAASALEIPMIARGEILGLLHIYCDQPGAPAKLAEIASVGSAMADAMSLALANLALRDKLRSQALRDPLTGLYNRRYMEDTLQRVVRLSEREKSDVSVIMIDLDHFKRLNDQYGHAKGDAVLRDVAALILSQLRESDVACRYGGEELMIILPQCSLAAAASKAERLRQSIEAMSDPKGAQVSASFGVASIPTTSRSTVDMMAAADGALYEAKQKGRNRVVTAQPLVSAPSLDPEEDFREALVAAE